MKFLKKASEEGRSRSKSKSPQGSLVAYSYMATSVCLPPGTIASYSFNKTSNALVDRCFQMISVTAFSRNAVDLSVGFCVQIIVEKVDGDLL